MNHFFNVSLMFLPLSLSPYQHLDIRLQYPIYKNYKKPQCCNLNSVKVSALYCFFLTKFLILQTMTTMKKYIP